MKILITGCNGRIGKYLVKILKKKHYVRGIDKHHKKNNLFDDFIESNLQNKEIISRSLDDIDIVVHLASLMSWHPNDNKKLFNSNVHGTFNLFSTIGNHSIKKFIFASSGEVYPETNYNTKPITEENSTLPTSTYGLTKLLGENIVKKFCFQNNINYIILRFGHSQYPHELFDEKSFFSGPRFYLNSKIKQLKKFPKNSVLVNTIKNLEKEITKKEKHYIGLDQNNIPYRMNITHVRDICSGIESAIYNKKCKNEIFNICSNQSFNFDDAIKYLSKFTKKDVVKIKLFTNPYNYDTSNEKAKYYLKYSPIYDIYKMIDEGAVLLNNNTINI